jgi:hypothetical protein
LEVDPDTPSHSTVLCRRRSPCRDQTSRWGIGKRDGMVNNDAMVGGRPAAWAAAAATTHRATNQSPSPGRGIQCGDARQGRARGVRTPERRSRAVVRSTEQYHYSCCPARGIPMPMRPCRHNAAPLFQPFVPSSLPEI